MPEIPSFLNDDAPHASGAAQASPSAFAAGGAALARGGEEFSNEMAQFNARYADAARSADASNIMADMSQKLGDMKFRWSKTPNRQQALDGFNKEAAELRKATIDKIGDPFVSSLVGREYDSESAMRAVETGSAAFGLEANKRTADLDNNLLSLAGSYASADTDAVRARVADNAKAAIALNVSGGWITPEEGQIRERNFGSQTQEVAVRQIYNDALANEDQNKAGALALQLDDPNAFRGLLPEKREILQQRVEQLQYRLETRAASRQAHEDAEADRQHREAQAHNEAALLGQIYAGHSVSALQLQQLANSGQITPGGMEAVHSAMDRQARGIDDAHTVVDMWHRIETGHAQPQDVYARAGQGISADTAASMVRALDARGTGGNAAERSAYSILKTAMNGQAIESGQYGGDKGPAIQAWSQAQGEWHSRVTINNEDPTGVLNDMMKRYAHAPRPTWLATPKFGAVNSFEDLQKAAIATVRARDAKMIDDATYGAQVTLLNQYKQYYPQALPKPGQVPAPNSGAHK